MSPQKHDQGFKKRATNAAALVLVQAKRETARANKVHRGGEGTPDESRAAAAARVQNTDWTKR